MKNHPSMDNSIDWPALTKAARAARVHAYAPYSKFRVGAAVLSSSGRIFAGANVENASYGLCLCAERSAVAQAVNAGAKKLIAAVVITQSSPPSSPCGMCRQTLVEFADDMPIRLLNTKGSGVETRLKDLLPGAFSRALLKS